ncbi:glycosyltransferase family 1 protein [Parathielavia appendiculata]|uniref:Glycosyltransferase family 1 protein n=1 Tax=Parathielavia appendiculata TaxID=2587402 RepID=A0AAN6YY84_9PEZI|nr:glycosyltransferase family 1 protein [Parathielavia appendiculata]
MKKVLLATNAEHGQANVFLAAGHALQALDADVDIHFASFSSISKDFSSASEYSVKCTKGARPWTFHLLDGLSMIEAVQNKPEAENLGPLLDEHPSFSTKVAILRVFMVLLMPHSGPEFIQVYKSFARVVDEVQPDIIVVDSLFSPVLTACRHLKLKHLVFSPNTLKDFSAALQPWGAMLWKFPAMGSAFEFPVPWTAIPANIFYCFYQIYVSLTDRRVKAMKAHIKRELGADVVSFDTLMLSPLPGQNILVGNRPETDFPLAYIPKHLTPCGPVIRPAPSAAEVDPELDSWLRRGPTVFISLGTHRAMDEDEALEMAATLRQLLEAGDARKEGGVGGVAGKLQVLWKLKRAKPTHTPTYEAGPGTRVYRALQNFMEADRIRILDWVKPQPSAVLEVGTVVCSINHGGANSFHDAVTCGVPQIVLPSWLDCYDFASRAEVLRIGRWGNKKTMPLCTAYELAPILIDVVLGPRAESMRSRVRELAALCARTPGATVAASAILAEVEDRKTK